jgi:hypothetical protein
MSENIQRDTSGRLLVAWAFLFTALVVLAWRIHLHPADYEWTEYPTALGDTAFYTLLGPDDDRYEPNLKFDAQGKGLFRRVEGTVEMDDAVMFKIAKESSGRCYVYKPVTAGRGAEPPVYLKAADGRYVEFGVKKYYKPYVPPER